MGARFVAGRVRVCDWGAADTRACEAGAAGSGEPAGSGAAGASARAVRMRCGGARDEGTGEVSCCSGEDIGAGAAVAAAATARVAVLEVGTAGSRDEMAVAFASWSLRNARGVCSRAEGAVWGI